MYHSFSSDELIIIYYLLGRRVRHYGTNDEEKIQVLQK